jgi:hypothetical protein
MGEARAFAVVFFVPILTPPLPPGITLAGKNTAILHSLSSLYVGEGGEREDDDDNILDLFLHIPTIFR